MSQFIEITHTKSKTKIARFVFLCSIGFMQAFETLSRCVFGQLIKLKFSSYSVVLSPRVSPGINAFP